MSDPAGLRPLFSPESVAVVGASRDPDAVGHRILEGLLRSGFQGPVYPVNPRARQVASVKAYPSVKEIGESVELAVVAVPAQGISEVVEDCGEAGVKALVVISAGFAETGEEGRKRQDELVRMVRDRGMRMLGPNCLGALYTHPEVRLNASFAPVLPPRGCVSLCSQSGALGIAVLSLARELCLGLRSFASVGNQADVAGDDLLEYWGEEDRENDVLLFYLESFKNPRRFGELARRICGWKPVVVVKGGRTEAGERAAGSHTAAVGGEEKAVEAFFRQTGLIRAETLQDMFGMARAIAEQPLPRGRRFAVVTNAGGPGILCADGLEAGGLTVSALEEGTRDKLEEILPEEASTANPVDMIASAGPEEYWKSLQTVLAADEVDGVVVIHTPVGVVEPEKVEEAILGAVAEARLRNDTAGQKPVYASVIGGEEEVYLLCDSSGHQREDPDRRRPGLSVPAFPFPEEIGRVAGRLVAYQEWKEGERDHYPTFQDQDVEGVRNLCRRALEERGEGWLKVEEARELLQRAGIPVARGGVAPTADEAAEVAADLGFPVAVKLASTEITHKTEMDAVKLGLETGDDVRTAFREIRERLREEDREDAMEGVLVQPHLHGAAEILLGMHQDPVFGPVLAFGLGGVYVEILEDVTFGVVPLCRRDAREMIRRIRGFRLLEGYRGHPAADLEALEEALLRLSTLADQVKELEELDLNPVFALGPGEGCRVVDARIRVREGSDSSSGCHEGSTGERPWGNENESGNGSENESAKEHENESTNGRRSA